MVSSSAELKLHPLQSIDIFMFSIAGSEANVKCYELILFKEVNLIDLQLQYSGNPGVWICYESWYRF